MPLRVRCQCGEALTMPDNKAGMEVMCPMCDQLITIPLQREVVPPPPPQPKPPPAPPADKKSPPKPSAKPHKPESPPAKSKPVTPPPLETAKERPELKSAAGLEQTSKPKEKPKPAANTAKEPNSAEKAHSSEQAKASPSPDKKSAKPIPKPRKVREKEVAAPTKPPGPPPLKKKSNSDSVAPSSEKADATESTKKSERPIAPVPPPRSSDSDATSVRKPSEKTKPIEPPPHQEKKASPIASPQPPAVPATEPEPQLPAQEDVRGVEHDPGKKWTVYQLGMCLAVMAFIGMYPAVMEVIRHYRDFDSRGIENWAYFVFLLSGIQLVYAIYMVQLPDWSTARVVMVISAMVSMLYATSMGMAFMADDDNAIIGALGLAAQHAEGYVSMWCCMMTLLMSLLTYFLVRTSLRWQRAYELATAGR